MWNNNPNNKIKFPKISMKMPTTPAIPGGSGINMSQPANPAETPEQLTPGAIKPMASPINHFRGLKKTLAHDERLTKKFKLV
jgi:hypothetical protein